MQIGNEIVKIHEVKRGIRSVNGDETVEERANPVLPFTNGGAERTQQGIKLGGGGGVEREMFHSAVTLTEPALNVFNIT